VTVVAGVIERGGRILIAQRKRGGRHACKWEFPGGKVEPGETPRDALVRELREELAIHARIGEQLDCYKVRYGNTPPIRLVFFRVSDFDREPQNLVFEQYQWAPRASLRDYDFLEGDLPFLERFCGEAGSSGSPSSRA
jgi:8-oxo-dGTP diphosphatase